MYTAICDGILENDALKNNQREDKNEAWTELLRELKFYEDIENHTNFLRRRWVLGAKEFMAGKHGSKQNDKEIFGYSDEDWNFIWSTMLEDEAWAVPAIQDDSGNILKDNFAPEIFIKYIAHDLQCNIIVLDLQLGKLQFCSGNHIKDDNVAFDSPLLIYSTGGHFQSCFQKDHEYFINYVREIEIENQEPQSNSANKTTSTNDVHVTPKKIPRQISKTQVNTETNPNGKVKKTKLAKPSTSFPKSKQMPIPKNGNRFSCLSESEGETNESIEHSANLEELKKIKNKDRTEEQKVIYQELMQLQRNEKRNEQQQRRRANATLQDKHDANFISKEKKAAKRAKQSPEEKRKINDKKREKMAGQRAALSPEEKRKVNDKQSERKAAQRAAKSPEEKKKVNDKRNEKLAAKSPEEKREINDKKSERLAAKSTEEKKKINNKKCEKIGAQRAKQRTSVVYKEGFRCQEIVEGNFVVSDLKDTDDSI